MDTNTKTCRTCGFSHPETDCPRWPARERNAGTEAPMFQNLSTDELKSLSAALITPRHGFNSNRMAALLGRNAAGPLSLTYGAIADEILALQLEVNRTLIGRFKVAA